MKQKKRKIYITIAIILGVLMLLLTACGSDKGGNIPSGSGGAAPEPVTEQQTDKTEEKDAPQIAGLTFTGITPLQYATCFTIYNYDQGYSLIDIPESGTYLVVPEGKDVPEGLDSDIVIRSEEHTSELQSRI